MRLVATAGRDHPDRGVVALLLLLDGPPHKRDARSVRRNLRVADPDKVPKVFFGDSALLRERTGRGSGEKNNNHPKTVKQITVVSHCFGFRYLDFVIPRP